MKVYALTSYFINVDAGDFSQEVIGIYDDIDRAKADMKKAVEDTENDFKEEDYETSEESDGVAEWSIWSKEQIMSLRCTIRITECELKTGGQKK